MKNKLVKYSYSIITCLFLHAQYVAAQILNCDSISAVELIAIKLSDENKTYSPSERDIRNNLNNTYKHKIYKQTKIKFLLENMNTSIICAGYKGIVYPKILIDITMLNGNKTTIIVGDLQNFLFNGNVYKQNPSLYKEILKNLPRRIKKGITIQQPIDSFCTQ